MRYNKVGYPIEMVSLELDLNWVDKLLGYVSTQLNSSGARGSLVVTSSSNAKYYIYVDDVRQSRIWGRRTIDYAGDFFFGDWRDKTPYDNTDIPPPYREFWFREHSWLNQFQATLVWGSALNDWDMLAKIGGYFQDGVAGNCEQSESNYSWYRILAGILRGLQWSQLENFRLKIEQGRGRSRHEQPLLVLLDSILHRDNDAVQNAALKLFAYLRKAKLGDQGRFYPLLCDGSFLVNYARHLGRSIAIPSDMIDRIITFDPLLELKT